MRKVCTIALFTVFLVAASAKDKLAILPFTGGEGEEGETIAELFSFEKDLVAVFNPVPRTSINRAIRSEERFQLGAGMTDPDTAASLGKQVGAQYVVSGNITAVGKQKLLIISILKIDDLRQIAGDIQTYTNIEEIQDKLPSMARNIAAAARKNASKLPRLAVTPVELSGGADAKAADTLAQVLAAHIIRNGTYAVYPRTASLDQIQAEYDTLLNEDTADEYLLNMRQSANPELVLSVTARRLGNQNMFNAAIINLETGVQETGASANYQSLEDGVSAVEKLAMSLSGKEWEEPVVQTASRILPNDLAEVFDTKSVTATFNAVHTFLQTCNRGSAVGRRERIGARIMLGDWIDLTHLTVQGDAGGGTINVDNIDLKEKGKLLRLIVVGIDSFAATNNDAPAHIVFQFQNIPGTHQMNTSNTNIGGYKTSEMRQYLADNFLRGLLAAGVPESVLYAPTRYIANGGQGATGADALADWLWLPTERELFENGTSYYNGTKFGWSNEIWETASNQARLEYYDSNSRRIKYDRGGNTLWWWEASPGTYSASSVFCYARHDGYASNMSASSVCGLAPAFCVR
jgi:hypothetical protein